MRHFRAPLGAAAILLALVTLVFVGIAAVRVQAVTTPERVARSAVDVESIFPTLTPVAFEAADGVSLAGWLAKGVPGRPAVILGHDLGADKSSLTDLARVLSGMGLTVLLLDFRGHGESGGRRSTLGLEEQRDVVAALQFLEEWGECDGRRVGIYGVGMGAHAAALAARHHPELRVLVLDALYPDVGYALTERVYQDWDFGRRHLAFVPLAMFAVLNQTAVNRQRAAGALSSLVGRDILLLAPSRDAELAAAMTRMYETIPEQADADGNIEFLAATRSEGLYGADLDAYHDHVAEFFRSRLRVP